MLHRPLQIETLKSVHKNGVQYSLDGKEYYLRIPEPARISAKEELRI